MIGAHPSDRAIGLRSRCLLVRRPTPATPQGFTYTLNWSDGQHEYLVDNHSGRPDSLCQVGGRSPSRREDGLTQPLSTAAWNESGPAA
jgi:hypothetical protein